MNTKNMKALRRNLRTNGTPAEGGLWKLLKTRQVGGLQFRRQFSVGAHILDFYCPALRLAIELDGNYHYYGSMPEHDQARDEELMHKYGIRTLRFENKIVFQQPNAIINSILQVQVEALQRINAPRPPQVLEGELDRPAAKHSIDKVFDETLQRVNAPQPPLVLEGELDRPVAKDSIEW